MPTAVATPETVSLDGVEMFLAGLQTDSEGRSKLWTPAELDEIAEAYNEVAGKSHDAPILVGHDGNTAYGWLSKAERSGDVLKGGYTEVDPDFAKGVNKGTYKKVSISIYPRDHSSNPTPGRYNIRHLAYVGVPAVKGLKPHKFADSDDGAGVLTFEFAAADLSFASPVEVLQWLFQGMRDRLIESKSIEVADAQLPASAINRLSGLQVDLTDFWRAIDRVQERLYQLEQSRSSFYSEAMTTTSTQDFADIASLAKDKDMDMAGLCKATKIPEEEMKGIWSGKQQPNAKQQASIAKALGVPPNMLGGKSSDETTDMTETKETPQVSPTGENTANAELLAQFSELKTQMGALATQLAAVQAENARLTQENAHLAEERERDRVTSFVEGLARDGKILPADKQSTIELALAMPHSATVNFSEGGEKTVRQQYLDRLAAGKPLYSTADMPTRPGDAPQFAEGGAGDPVAAKAKEMGLDPNKAEDYAEAMTALGYTY